MALYRLLFAALLLSLTAFAQTETKPDAQAAPPAQTEAKPAAQPSDMPPPPPPNGATHLMGFEGVKRDAKSKLTIAGGKLQFEKASIDTSSISDIFTGSESRQTGGVPLTLAKMAAPFGSGRALSLFTHAEYDNITIEYTDANGGLHGAIFMLPKGKAEALKKDLVAAGAHATIPLLQERKQTTDANKEKK
jgi:hypothetical protein